MKVNPKKLLTVLANERTLLAYVRTSLTLFVAGVSFIRFFTVSLVVSIGIIFVAAGVIILFVGAARHWVVRNHIKNGS